MGADSTVAALTEYYVERFNLANRDAEYTKNRWTLNRLTRDGKKLKTAKIFHDTVRVADAWSDSPDFATGMVNFVNDSTFQWDIGANLYPHYGRVTFEGELLNRQEPATIIDTKSASIDGIQNNMLDSVEFMLWNTVAARGRIAAAGLGGTAAARILTLTSEDDVYNFPVNMRFEGSDTDTGAGLIRVDKYTVTSIDPIGLKVHASRHSGAAGDLLANDYLFALGSKDAYMPGIATFIPATDPTDTLFGVPRTGQGPVLSGWRFPYVGSISETILRAFAKMGKYVNRTALNFTACLSVEDWILLSLEQTSTVVRDEQASQRFGVEVISVRTPFGNVPCVAVPQLKSGRGWIVDWSVWKLYTLGNLPHIIDDDGNVMLRLAPGSPSGNNLNGDGVEMRFRMWKVLSCVMPMSNCTFPTA